LVANPNRALIRLHIRSPHQNQQKQKKHKQMSPQRSTSYEEQVSSTPPRRGRIAGKVLAIGSAVIIALLFALGGQIFEKVNADEVVVIQYPNGSLNVISKPTNFAPQWFGTVTHFKRSTQYWFSMKGDEGSKNDDSIKTRFNDGAHGYVSGSMRFDMPETPEKIIDLFRTYRTQAAVERELIGQNLTKAVYMTGPLMSSKESYSDRRNELISDIEDQAINGVYRTVPKDVEIEDPITQTKKWIRSVDIQKDPKTGIVLRQEESPIQRFGIRLYNLNINEIRYDKVVEDQIAAQQHAIMQVQTAMAQSKEAEQKAITIAKQGEAEATKAKWEQETIKAREVTKAQQEAAVATTAAERDKRVAELGAEQRKNVAELDRAAAEFTKAQQIALGQGEGERKRLAMAANGALEQKLAAWQYGQEVWAKAFAAYKGDLVPRFVAGNTPGTTSAGSGNALNDFMQLMTMKTAQSLDLDMAMKPKPEANR
jgi:hypothetical protein